jgi:hypothetical protein
MNAFGLTSVYGAARAYQSGSKSGVIFGSPLAGKIKLKKGFFDATTDNKLLGSTKKLNCYSVRIA